MPKDNSKAARERRQAAAAERLAHSTPCTCGSAHTNGHKGGKR